MPEKNTTNLLAKCNIKQRSKRLYRGMGGGGGAPKFLGRGCSSYLLRVKIQGFGTAWGAIDEILAFLHTVHTNRDIKSRIGSSS